MNKEHIKSLYKYIFTLFLGALGVLVAMAISLPLPWVLGAILSIAFATRFQTLPLKNPKPILITARMFIGLTIGSTFNPKVLEEFDKYILSLLLIAPMVLIIGAIGTWYYYKIQKFDKLSAYFSAMPGGLLEMILIGKDMGADASKITLTQSTRLFLVIFFLPFLIEHLTHISLDGLKPITGSIIHIPISELFLMVIVGASGIYFAKKINLFGAYILGPMLLSIVAYSLGILEYKPPDEAIKAVQLLIGISIGFTFYGIDRKTIIKTIVSTFGFFLLLVIICGFFIFIAHYYLHFPLLATILAFSPGGQADISLMAIIIGENIPYIILHHIIRLSIVIGFATIFARRLK